MSFLCNISSLPFVYLVKRKAFWTLASRTSRETPRPVYSDSDVQTDLNWIMRIECKRVTAVSFSREPLHQLFIVWVQHYLQKAEQRLRTAGGSPPCCHHLSEALVDVHRRYETPPSRYSPLRYSLLRYPPLRYPPLRYPPLRYSLLRYPPLRYQPLRYPPSRYSLLRYPPLRYPPPRYGTPCYGTTRYVFLCPPPTPSHSGHPHCWITPPSPKAGPGDQSGFWWTVLRLKCSGEDLSVWVCVCACVCGGGGGVGVSVGVGGIQSRTCDSLVEERRS